NSHPGLAARLEGAKQTSELLSSAPLASRARAGVAGGIALLGDAAGSADPITGGGITQALQAAELLAIHVAAKLGTDEEWLSEFDKQRRALLRGYGILTRCVLWLSDHPRIARWALSRLDASPTLFSHLIGVSGGARRLWAPGSCSRQALACTPLAQQTTKLTGIGELRPRTRDASSQVIGIASQR